MQYGVEGILIDPVVAVENEVSVAPKTHASADKTNAGFRMSFCIKRSTAWLSQPVQGKTPMFIFIFKKHNRTIFYLGFLTNKQTQNCDHARKQMRTIY